MRAASCRAASAAEAVAAAAAAAQPAGGVLQHAIRAAQRCRIRCPCEVCLAPAPRAPPRAPPSAQRGRVAARPRRAPAPRRRPCAAPPAAALRLAQPRLLCAVRLERGLRRGLPRRRIHGVLRVEGLAQELRVRSLRGLQGCCGCVVPGGSAALSSACFRRRRAASRSRRASRAAASAAACRAWSTARAARRPATALVWSARVAARALSRALTASAVSAARAAASRAAQAASSARRWQPAPPQLCRGEGDSVYCRVALPSSAPLTLSRGPHGVVAPARLRQRSLRGPALCGHLGSRRPGVGPSAPQSRRPPCSPAAPARLTKAGTPPPQPAGAEQRARGGKGGDGEHRWNRWRWVGHPPLLHSTHAPAAGARPWLQRARRTRRRRPL